MPTQSGYQNADVGADTPQHVLFLTSGQTTKTITIDPTTRDANSPLGTTYLRAGLILVPITATGLYKQFDTNATDGTEDPENAVVLKQLINIGTKPVVAAAWSSGNFKSDMLYVGAGFTWSSVQRIIRHSV